MTAALAIAAFAGANAANPASATNTMRVIVPQVLSVTANPASQNHYMTAAGMFQEETMDDVLFTIKSNATYNAVTTYSHQITYLNDPVQADRVASEEAFRNNLKYKRTTDNLEYSLGFLEDHANHPFNELNQPFTPFDGTTYSYKSRLVGMGFEAAPGTYVAVLTVTVTQP